MYNSLLIGNLTKVIKDNGNSISIQITVERENGIETDMFVARFTGNNYGFIHQYCFNGAELTQRTVALQGNFETYQYQQDILIGGMIIEVISNGHQVQGQVPQGATIKVQTQGVIFVANSIEFLDNEPQQQVQALYQEQQQMYQQPIYQIPQQQQTYQQPQYQVQTQQVPVSYQQVPLQFQQPAQQVPIQFQQPDTAQTEQQPIRNNIFQQPEPIRTNISPEEQAQMEEEIENLPF